MKAKDFITRPDIMAIYNEKGGVTQEVLNSITSVAGYQIAKEEMGGETTEEPTETTNVEPIEEPIKEPTPEKEPEQTEPEISVEDEEK